MEALVFAMNIVLTFCFLRVRILSLTPFVYSIEFYFCEICFFLSLKCFVQCFCDYMDQVILIASTALRDSHSCGFNVDCVVFVRRTSRSGHFGLRGKCYIGMDVVKMVKEDSEPSGHMIKMSSTDVDAFHMIIKLV